MHHPWVTALVLAIVVTVLVLINTPKNKDAPQKTNTNTKAILKTFLISLIVCSIVVYIMQDNEDNNIMTNIIKGEPDF